VASNIRTCPIRPYLLVIRHKLSFGHTALIIIKSGSQKMAPTQPGLIYFCFSKQLIIINRLTGVRFTEAK
jgi:hypothetical protein